MRSQNPAILSQVIPFEENGPPTTALQLQIEQLRKCRFSAQSLVSVEDILVIVFFAQKRLSRRPRALHFRPISRGFESPDRDAVCALGALTQSCGALEISGIDSAIQRFMKEGPHQAQNLPLWDEHKLTTAL